VREKAGFGVEFKRFIEFSAHMQNCAALSVMLVCWDFWGLQNLYCNNTTGYMMVFGF